MSNQLQQLLSQHWGYSQFRTDQKEIIEHLLRGENALVLMPTGSGKSLCYQLPSLILEDLVLVISPLIALMKDQVDDAQKKGLEAAFINSSLGREERKRAYRDLSEGKIKLLYVTPERFRKQEFLDAIGKREVSLLAVDEAHCISEWGHDFRPDYTRLQEIRKTLGNPVTIALTATATKDVRADIFKQLGLPETTELFCSGFKRENLDLKIQDVVGLDDKLRTFVFLHQQTQGAKIIYFSLVDTLKKFSYELNRMNIEHLVYHGQLSASERRINQSEFQKAKDPLILATPAFGLGVNKANVRSVIHAEIPGSIEAYYQEVGRAGRDGLPSYCMLLYDQDDVTIQMDFLKWANPEPSFIEQVYKLILKNKDRVRQEGYEFLREQMLFYHKRDFRLETAIKLLDRWGVLENFHNFREWEIVDEIPAHVVDQSKYENSVKSQQQKLLQMVQLTRYEGDIKEEIERYFELS